MGATFPRLKSWTALENLTNLDLNAEINNILNNLTPAGVDDSSASVGAMKQMTSPGILGAESLATSLQGEIERIRYMLDVIIGKTYWYEAPALNLEELNSSLGNALPQTRIVSGKILSTTSKGPIFLQPHGTNATVALKGLATSFVYRITGTSYTVAIDVSTTGLSLAPSTNNTCLVNDPGLTAQAESKFAGETDSSFPEIIIDTVGSEITALIGKYAAFKKGSEYFFAYVESATRLSRAYRGFFFDSGDSPIVRETISDNDSITLCKLTWVFVKADGTLAIAYSNPIWAFDQPTSPAIGDYWFDLNNQMWKSYNGSSWIDATALLVGMCVQDTAGTKAARSLEFAQVYNPTNTLSFVKVTSNTIQTVRPGGKISVCGTEYDFGFDFIEWDMPGDLASGVSEASSTDYFLYITSDGDTLIDSEKPYNREDLFGKYHPYNAWRCVGKVTNDGSSNFSTFTGFGVSSVAQINSSLIPTGAIVEFAGTVAPEPDYLMCNGKAYSRTAYTKLFSIIGIQYGPGDGSTTFNVPDRRGNHSRGLVGLPDRTFATTDVTTGTDTIALALHNFNRTGFKVQFTSSGTLPAGLALLTNYYVIVVTPGTFKVASSPANAFAGTAVDITDVGSGTHTVHQWEDPDAASRFAYASGGNSGDNIGAFIEGAFEAHQHTSGVQGATNAAGGANVRTEAALGSTGVTGGIETRGRSIAMNYLIKT